MHVSGDLGFSSLVIVVSLLFPVIGLIFRRKWRLSIARREEIKRLVILASEEAARAELEATLGYGAVSVPQYPQCAVCFSPTTTRCAQCKAVRYCSGKCQIIHWRQGHKDECHPPSITQDNNDEGANSIDQKWAGQEECELNDDRFKFEARQPPTSIGISSEESAMSYTSTPPEVPHGKNDEVKIELHADGEGASSTSEYSDSSFSGFSASHTSSESSDDVSVCESISSNESEKLDGPLSAGISVDMLETVSSVKNLDQTKPLSPKFASLVDSVDNYTNLNKLSKIKPGCSREGQCTSTSSSGSRISRMHEGSNAESCTVSSGFWGRTLESTMDACADSSRSNSPSCSSNLSPSPSLSARGFEVKGIVSDDALLAASGRPKDGVAKTSNVDFLEVRSSPSLNCKSSSLTVNGTNVASHTPKSREVKASVSFSSHVPPSSSVRKDSTSVDASNISSLQSSSSEKSNTVINDNGGTSHRVEVHSVPSVRSGRINDVQASSPLFSRVESCFSNDKNGIKTSLWKAVDQFRGPKSSKQYPYGVGSETAGRYSDKGLFSYELFVKLYNWNKVELQPCGLINCGNSCYANAVLQCLTVTPPLTAYFLQGLHSKECAKKEWCFTCEFENLILKAKEGKSPLSPIGILSQLQSIGSQLGNGREEDAHEFLRYAIDTMQSVCLKEARVNASGPLEEETTLIGLTFGGYLRSKIKCMKCQGKSERQERMMDLTVEIEGDIRSLEEALQRFSGTEILDGENKYQCGRCKSYEKAKKKLTILEAPNILTIALKRFQSGKFGKLNKSIQFPEILNLAPYMSGTSDKSPIYRLYGVVVHLDIMNAAFSGHYVCYVKSSQNKWFKIDDSMVTPVEREKVLAKGAYMLLYARCSPRAPRLIRNRIISHDPKNKVIPSWVTGKTTASNLKSPSTHSSVVQFYPSSIPPDGPAGIESFYSRYHQLQKILEEDSSDSSSLISSNSDEGSCSTDSTRDSSSTDDISDYIFGDSGCGWNSPWRNSSDSDTSSLSSSSPLATRHSAFSNSDQADYTGSGMEGVGHSRSNKQGHLEGRGNISILHYDRTKQCRKLASSSCR
ncbi:ubiquitin carboxyl-terminal hydrolase 16-like [Pistacia vera]|uniref:ubiquitin carboxyl-terminal hydrolase 16-like n=1 Tax=Pistacia vera TaxID=55513 RepID=UPI001262ECC5|nr:ubiquitin carboxyl-terminal hydrolase 16-like [Pistacia vera]